MSVADFKVECRLTVGFVFLSERGTAVLALTPHSLTVTAMFPSGSLRFLFPSRRLLTSLLLLSLLVGLALYSVFSTALFEVWLQFLGGNRGATFHLVSTAGNRGGKAGPGFRDANGKRKNGKTEIDAEVDSDSDAAFHLPVSLRWSPGLQRVLVADYGNAAVRWLDPEDGRVGTLVRSAVPDASEPAACGHADLARLVPDDTKDAVSGLPLGPEGVDARRVAAQKRAGCVWDVLEWVDKHKSNEVKYLFTSGPAGVQRWEPEPAGNSFRPTPSSVWHFPHAAQGLARWSETELAVALSEGRNEVVAIPVEVGDANADGTVQKVPMKVLLGPGSTTTLVAGGEQAESESVATTVLALNAPAGIATLEIPAAAAVTRLLFVADHAHHRVVTARFRIVSGDAKLLSTSVSAEDLLYPVGVAAERANELSSAADHSEVAAVYITDNGHHRVVRAEVQVNDWADGNLSQHPLSFPGLNRALEWPGGIALSDDGRWLFVTESTHRVATLRRKGRK